MISLGDSVPVAQSREVVVGEHGQGAFESAGLTINQIEVEGRCHIVRQFFGCE